MTQDEFDALVDDWERQKRYEIGRRDDYERVWSLMFLSSNQKTGAARKADADVGTDDALLLYEEAKAHTKALELKIAFATRNGGGG